MPDKTDFPNYECAAYQKQLPIWTYLEDLFTGVDAWTERMPDGTVQKTQKTQHYLPQFPKELDGNYLARLVRSPFSDHFAQAIKDFAGIVFHNNVRLNLSEAMLPHWANLDNKGSSGDSLVSNLAIAAMKLGHVFVLIDYPPDDPSIRSQADYALSGRRPYWVPIHPRQLINWRTANVGGVEVLTMAVIKQTCLEPDGFFGEVEKTHYMVLVPGGWKKYEITGVGDRQSVALVAEGLYMAHGQPLPFIPLVPIYGGVRPPGDPWGQSMQPLRSLADLNLAHYQLRSDHLHKIHRCCFPQAVRSGTMADEETLTLGVDTCLDIPMGGSFAWAEPRSGSIEQTRMELASLEQAMDFLSAQFLVKPSDRQAAMVSMVQAAKVESGLQLFVNSFQHGINQCLKLHGFYLGTEAGTVSLSSKFLQQQAADPNLLTAYSNYFERLLRLPPDLRRSLLDIAKRRGYLPEDFDDVALLAAPQQSMVDGVPVAPLPLSSPVV
jgi:Domain of unknown function (DUF4055)